MYTFLNPAIVSRINRHVESSLSALKVLGIAGLFRSVLVRAITYGTGGRSAAVFADAAGRVNCASGLDRAVDALRRRESRADSAYTLTADVSNARLLPDTGQWSSC